MSREGATVERHLALLGVRDAYLLLVLVPLGQRHVLTTIPTGKGEEQSGGLELHVVEEAAAVAVHEASDLGAMRMYCS